MKTALVAGATGLIGNALVRKLLAADRYQHVIALTRQPLRLDHPKFQNILTDFQDLGAALAGVRPDDVFCCLGTTMAIAGFRKKFQEVDFEYPYALAKVTHRLGAKQYFLVSALGADKNSRIFYNRVKGEVEGAIRGADFECIHIFRPSLLLGPRTEKRTGEEIAKLVYKVFGFAIPEKYRAVEGEKVADAMITFASKDQRGIFIHESRKIRDM
jgi:uncharacterized protein YbjT (DUF2867 family)